jgi:hypothetical protein
MAKHKKSPLKATQLHKRKRRIFLLKSFAVLTLVALCIIGLAWLSQAKAITIQNIVVEGNSGVTSYDIEEVVHKHIEGKFALLFSKNNRFLYSKNKITDEISLLFTQIENVDLEVEGTDLHVRVKERTPRYTWCSGVPQTDNKDDCYFLDERGFIFSEAPVFSGNAYVAFYGLITGEKPIGSTYLNKDTFENINKFIEFLHGKKIHPYALLASTNGTLEVFFDRGTKMILKSDQDIASLISNIDLVMTDTTVFSDAQRPNLEYIDMRFGNKLYYKLKGDNPLQVSQEGEV